MKPIYYIVLVIGWCIATTSCNSVKKETGSRSLYIEKSKSVISMYLPAGTDSTGYVRVDLQHFLNNSKRTDLWRLSKGFVVTRNRDNSFSNIYSKDCIYPGEWDCAIITKRNGKINDDAMGGFHGYEELTKATFSIDEREIELTTTGTFKAQTVQFTQHSIMFDYGTNHPIASHTKEYTIVGNTINMKQQVEWLKTTEIERAFLAMLPISRSLPDGTQITDRVQIEGDPTIYDVSKSNKDLDVSGKDIGKVSIWGQESGLQVDMEVQYKPLLSDNKFFCSMYTAQDGYNKLYFRFCGNRIVEEGTVWTSNNTYHFSLNTKKETSH